LLPLVLRASASESSARNVEGQSVKLQTDAKKSALIAMVSESLHRAQLSILLVLN